MHTGSKFRDFSIFSTKVREKRLSQIRETWLEFSTIFFIDIASKLKEPTLKADFEILKNFMGDKVPNDIDFKIHLTNHAFIRIFLSNLNVNKSTG